MRFHLWRQLLLEPSTGEHVNARAVLRRRQRQGSYVLYIAAQSQIFTLNEGGNYRKFFFLRFCILFANNGIESIFMIRGWWKAMVVIKRKVRQIMQGLQKNQNFLSGRQQILFCHMFQAPFLFKISRLFSTKEHVFSHCNQWHSLPASSSGLSGFHTGP